MEGLHRLIFNETRKWSQGPIGIISRDEIRVVMHISFKVSNNETEYEALLTSLWAIGYVEAFKVVIHSAFQQVDRQLEGEYEVKNEWL